MAQPRATKVQLHLVPNHSDALYSVGEQAKVKVMATDCGMALNDVVVNYEVSEDLMTPHITKSITLKGNEGEITLGTMKKPGYLRVKAVVEKDGKKYSAISTVGYDTEKLQPTVTLPDDFKAFWDAQLEAARKIDLQPTMTLIPERCTDKVNVYHISYRNINNTRMYGMLTMPKAEGKYPAIIMCHGYNGSNADFVKECKYFAKHGYVAFSLATLEYAKQLNFKADIIHSNDWHTAMIPLYIKANWHTSITTCMPIIYCIFIIYNQILYSIQTEHSWYNSYNPENPRIQQKDC